MSAVCPAGHTSTSEDYCDVCGVPIDASDAGASTPPAVSPPPAPDAPADVPGQQACPNCSSPNAVDALFCENCGFDFTTGSMPRPLDPPTPIPDQPIAGPLENEDPGSANPDGEIPDGDVPGQPGPPAQAAVDPASAGTRAPATHVAEVWIDPAWYEAQQSPDQLPSAGLPDVVPLRAASCLIGRVSQSRNIHPDVDCGTDSGVSRRQSQLTTDGSRWWVEDLESANGTFVGPANGALPVDPIPVGTKTELAPDDRIYVGAWTRIVVRPATEDEAG